jgi:hypothetical protein
MLTSKNLLATKKDGNIAQVKLVELLTMFAKKIFEIIL